MWAWDLKNAMHHTGSDSGFDYWPTGGSPNYSGFFNYEKSAGMQYIITKAADGNGAFVNAAGVTNYTSAVLTAAHNAGLKILPYFYIYGGSSSHKTGVTTTVQGEIDVFNSTISSIGGDGAVLDIEAEYATAVPSATQAIVQYATGIGKSQAGDGSGSRDNFFIAYSSFPYVSVHTNDPYVQLGDYFDAAMPQAYWSSWTTDPVTSHIRPSNVGATLTPTMMVDDVNSQYSQIAFDGLHNIFYGHPESIKPVIITGMTYDGDSTKANPGNPTTAAEITEFNNAAMNSTQVPTTGPSGVNTYQSFGYRGINYFDENSTNASERTALAAPTVAVAPGAPVNSSPANASNLSAGIIALDWSDVVTTSTSAAATSYDVYVDGVLQTNVATSQYTIPAGLGAGSHTWQIFARDALTTTAGPTWSFNIGLSAPSNLSITTYGSNSASLSWTDNSSSEAKFLVERKVGVNGTYSQIGSANANATTFTDNTAQPGADYYYRVRASDGGSGFSSYSNEAHVVTLAAIPGGLTASDGLFSDHVALSWSTATGAASYQVYRNTINDPASATSIGNPTAASFNDSTATANTTYYYWVASYNSASVVSAKSSADTGYSDSIAPTITAKSFQNQFGPPYLSFTFSEPPQSVSASNLTITNLDTVGGAVPTIASVSYSPNTAKFFLSADMPDGNYRATISGVTDPAGNALSGSKTYDFYFLRGDASGDRVVNALDFNALAGNFGSTTAGFSGGDFNFDGTVNTQDFSAMCSRWGTLLPAPTPAAPLAASPAPTSLFNATPITDKSLSVLDPDQTTL
jgi:hypothetical protein